MAIVEQQVPVTIRLPQSVIDRVGEAAGRDNHTVEEELRSLIGLALALEGDLDELAVKAEDEYAAHLAATGQKRPTTEELWEQMRRIREEVADEFYP